MAASEGEIWVQLATRIPKHLHRELKLYCVSFSTPLSVETVPFPSFSPPRQMALPFRCMTNHLHEIFCDQKWYQTKLWRNGDAANEKGAAGAA